jgi:flagellar motor protein MotB
MHRALPLLAALVLPRLASAQDLLTYSLKPAVQIGTGYPQVILRAEAEFKKVELVCDRDGTEVKLTGSALSKGQSKAFDLKQPEGAFTYDCEARGYYGSSNEEYFDLPMRFEAFLGGGLKIAVPRDRIDKDRGQLVATADREIVSGQLLVIGPDGPEFEGPVEIGSNSAGDDIEISWIARGEVLRLDVTLTDRWGFFAYEKLFPWSLEIPHEDVNFDTASSEIRADQQPKIDAAADEIRKVVDRYGKFVEVQLFVAGYTDTVGDRDANYGLSERRARSIAAALRAKGFRGKVYYQGFGEDVLKIPTGDSVDESLNRRALYLLGSTAPGTSAELPRGNWKAL